MRPIGIVLTSLILAFVIATPVAAQSGAHNRYKWKDAQSNLHFDDALPNEALQFGYDVVNSHGLVIKHVGPPKTAAELKADADADARKAAEKHVHDEQTKSDQQLLAAYPNESDLVDAQKAQLDMLDQNIHATQISLDSQEKSLTTMLSHAADLDRTGKPVPATLQSQIESLRRNVERQKTYIVQKQQEKAGLAQKFADALTHYRGLRTGAKH
jgi:hypothetical protein